MCVCENVPETEKLASIFHTTPALFRCDEANTTDLWPVQIPVLTQVLDTMKVFVSEKPITIVLCENVKIDSVKSSFCH